MGAAALPAIAHLLMKRPKRTVVLPTARFLAHAQREFARGRRLREFVLLTIRSLALLLLGFAFATPQWEKIGPLIAVDGPTVFVLDASASMSRTEAGRRLFDVAKDEIVRRIERSRGDELGLIFADSNPHAALPRMTRNTDALLAALLEASPTYERTNANDAIAAALAIPANDRADRAARRVVFVTDAQRTGFRDLDVHAGAHIEIVRVGRETEPPNRAIVDASISPAMPIAGERFTVSAKLANYSPEHATIPVTMRRGEDVSSAVYELAPWSEMQISLPFRARSPGVCMFELSIPEDSMPTDDSAFLAVNVAEARRVAVLSASDGAVESDVSIALRAVFKDSVAMAVAQADDRALREYSAVLVAQCGTLPDQILRGLALFTRGGGVLVWIIDSEESADSLLRLPSPTQGEVLIESIDFGMDQKGAEGDRKSVV